jgi:linoleoyl-CoA desaturase
MQKVYFSKGDFHQDIKQKVDAYFQEKNTTRFGNYQLYVKVIVFIPATLLVYFILLFGSLPTVAAIACCMLLGFLLAGIGFNIMHDGNHGSFSRHKWLNSMMGQTLNVIGGNTFIWKRKHNMSHHSYTNIDGLDDDIAKSPILRQCESQKWVPAHRYQHWYVLILYALSGLFWIFVFDFVKYFNKKMFTTVTPDMKWRDHVEFWFFKALYVCAFIVLPVSVVGAGAWAIGYLVMNVTMGLILAFVFQLAHVVEETQFVAGGTEPRKLENEWAIHQLQSTANFAISNKFVTWYTGSLNYQVEHHLFPSVSHVHYPSISPIVQQLCLQYDVPYHCYPSFTKAVASHFRHMKRLGRGV